MAVIDPKIRQVQLSDGEHDISAKYALINNKDVEIAQLIDVTSDIVKTATLPAANATTWQQYHTSIVLTPKTGGGYDENIIVKGGTSTTPTYEWVDIGDTSIDLSGAAKAGTYWSTSNGSQTATGTATISYDKPNANTGYATPTVKSATGSFTGTTATISASYRPAGSIGGSQSVTAHSHTVNVSNATVNVPTNAIKSVALSTATTGGVSVVTTAPTEASSAGGHTHTVNVTKDSATTFVTTEAIKSAALATTTATTGITVPVTLNTQAASAGGHSHSIGASTTSITPAVAATTAVLTSVGADGTANVVTGYASPTKAALATTSIRPAKAAYAFSSSQASILTTATVSSAGVLSWNSVAGSTDIRGTAVTVATGGTTTGTTFLTGLGTASTTTVLTGVKGTGSYKPAVVGTGVTVVTGVDANTGSAGAHTHSLSGGSVGKMTVTTTAASTVSKQYVTGATTSTDGAHTHSLTGAASKTLVVSGTAADTTSVTYVTGATTSTAGAVTINGSNFSFSGTTATISADYQPAGTVGVSVTMNSHSHSIGTTSTSATGTAAVAVSSHSHQVTVPEL